MEEDLPSHARIVVSAGGFEAVLPVAEIGPQLVEWAMNGARRGPTKKTHGDGRLAHECHVGHRFDGRPRATGKPRRVSRRKE